MIDQFVPPLRFAEAQVAGGVTLSFPGGTRNIELRSLRALHLLRNVVATISSDSYYSILLEKLILDVAFLYDALGLSRMLTRPSGGTR